LGYERALSSLYLEESDRVSQVEFLQHTDYIAKISGLDPLQSPEEARSKAFQRLDLDMVWFTHNPMEDFIRRSYRRAETRRDSWSRAYPTEWRKTFEVKTIEDIIDFDPFQAWIVPGLGELSDSLQRVHGKFQGIYRHQLVPGGTYHTCLMWLIRMFGLEWTIKAAYMDPRGFEKLLGRFGSLSKLEARAWAQTGIKAFISHDDICSTRGPFFPLSWMRRYLFPWYHRIWQELRSKGIRVLFCTDGNMTSLADDIAKAGADGFIVEECCDLKGLAEVHGNDMVIIGGVDVGILTYGTVEDVVDEVRRCLGLAGAYPGYFINVSGSIPDNVPLTNLEAYFKAVKKYGLRSPRKPLSRASP
jgi:hypothetical protein